MMGCSKLEPPDGWSESMGKGAAAERFLFFFSEGGFPVRFLPVHKFRESGTDGVEGVGSARRVAHSI